jgi:hypothetical protein
MARMVRIRSACVTRDSRHTRRLCDNSRSDETSHELSARASRRARLYSLSLCCAARAPPLQASTLLSRSRDCTSRRKVCHSPSLARPRIDGKTPMSREWKRRGVVRKCPPLLRLTKGLLFPNPLVAPIKRCKQRRCCGCLVNSAFDQEIAAATVLADAARDVRPELYARTGPPRSALARAPHWVGGARRPGARMQRHYSLVEKRGADHVPPGELLRVRKHDSTDMGRYPGQFVIERTGQGECERGGVKSA